MKSSSVIVGMMTISFGLVSLNMIQTSSCTGVEITKDHKKIEEIKSAIVSLVEEYDANRGDGTSIGPTLIRLAW